MPPPRRALERAIRDRLLHRGLAEQPPRPGSRALRGHFAEAQIVERTLRIAPTGFFSRVSPVLGIEEEAQA